MEALGMALCDFKILKRDLSLLKTAYVRMKNSSLSEEKISLEFVKSRIPLPHIVWLFDFDLVRNMIANGADVNKPIAGNFRALDVACRQEKLKIAELLLQNNAVVDPLNGEYPRPLMTLFNNMCSTSDKNLYYQMTRLLVSYGAKLDPLDLWPMANALRFANRDTLRLLVNEANADLSFRFNGSTCLHLAVANKEPGALEYVAFVFKKRNLDIDVRDDSGETPLLLASNDISGPNHRAVKILLLCGADFNVTNSGSTSFDRMIYSDRDLELAWMYFDLGLDLLGPKVNSLNLAIKNRSPWMKDIVAELATRVTMGATITGQNQRVFEVYEQARRYMRLCKQQLTEMRKTKFYENVSFWDVLTADKTKLMEYAGNFELVQALFEFKCNSSFSVYCSRIRYKFFTILPRNRRFELSTCVVCETIKLPIMYDIFRHKVMDYMTPTDLFKILTCCRTD